VKKKRKQGEVGDIKEQENTFEDAAKPQWLSLQDDDDFEGVEGEKWK
jgi:hypothetical protein